MHKDRGLVGRVLVGRHQPHHPTPGTAPEVPDQRVSRVGGPLADHQADDQPALGVEGHVVPAVPMTRVVVSTILLLFTDERPLLVELHRGGLRGKKRPTRRGVRRRGRRRVGCTVRRCPGGRRCARGGGSLRPAMTPPSTSMIVPVTQPACSESRKVTAAEMSSVVPMRLRGWKGPNPERHHDFIDVEDLPVCWQRRKMLLIRQPRLSSA